MLAASGQCSPVRSQAGADVGADAYSPPKTKIKGGKVDTRQNKRQEVHIVKFFSRNLQFLINFIEIKN